LLVSNPVDPNRVLVFQTESCEGVGRGLTEYSVNSFHPVKLLVPAAEFGGNLEFDWLHDGSGIIYLANDGLVRLDLATSARTVFYKFDPNVYVLLAVGPGDEVIVSIQGNLPMKNPPSDIYHVFPETGMAVL
jgi:hypothetical protein